MKKNKIMSENFEEFTKDIPIDIQVTTTITMTFIDLITKLGYRENIPWGNDENAQIHLISTTSKDLADEIIMEIRKK